jgi:hypothetical protein
MHSVCILICVSMYLYSYLSTHGKSGLAASGNQEQFEVCLKLTIEWTQRYTPRPWSSKFRHAIGDWQWVNSEMYWEAVIKQVCRCTGRPWLSEIGDALTGYDRARLEEYLDMIDLEAVDGRGARWWDSIYQLVNSKPWECDEVTLPLKLLWRTGWWQLICRKVCHKLKIHSGVNSKSKE